PVPPTGRAASGAAHLPRRAHRGDLVRTRRPQGPRRAQRAALRGTRGPARAAALLRPLSRNLDRDRWDTGAARADERVRGLGTGVSRNAEAGGIRAMEGATNKRGAAMTTK